MSTTAEPAAPCTSATVTSTSSTRLSGGWNREADCLTSPRPSPHKCGAREKSSPPPPGIHRNRQQGPLRDHRRQRRLLAHLECGGRELFDDQHQPRRIEIAQRG